MPSVIAQTIALLTQATTFDAAKFEADTRKEYLTASIELRDAVLRFAGDKLTEAQQIERNLAETRRVLALLRDQGSIAEEAIEHFRVCAEQIVDACRDATERGAAATA